MVTENAHKNFILLSFREWAVILPSLMSLCRAEDPDKVFPRSRSGRQRETASFGVEGSNDGGVCGTGPGAEGVT
jgi:hypothetical protein